MANTSNNPMSTCHFRKISLPSSDHPITTSLKDQLDRLKSSEAASSSPAFLACQKLGGLKNLYDCIDDWLKLPQTQQDLSLEHTRIFTEELLDGSLKLLDVCGNTREFFSQMKDYTQELQSSLRRQKGVDEVITSRKQLNKVITKYLQNLKRKQKSNTPSQDCNQESSIRILRETEEISQEILQTLLCFLCGKNTRSKISSWSSVSELLSTKRASSKEGKKDGRETECLDTEVLQEIDEPLESIFRHLLKIRVSLLNLLNN